MRSSLGVQQGDPAGSALFCLAIQELVESLTCPFTAWYCDDGVLIGSAEEVCDDVRRIQAFEAVSGLALNPSKCEVHVVNGDHQDAERALQEIQSVLPEVAVADVESLELLGAALYDEGLRHCVTKKREKMVTALGRLGSLTSQEGLLLLRMSLFAPRLIHVLRTFHCFPIQDLLEELDDLLKGSLQKVLNTDFDTHTMKKATLPVRAGGLGIRSPRDLRLPCILSSLASARVNVQALLPASVFVEYEELLAEISTLFPLAEDTTCDISCQREIDGILCEESYQDLLAAADPSERACMLASRQPLSYSWMYAIPHPNLGTCIDDRTVSTAICLRLHVRVCQPHPCALCQEPVGCYGHHALHCAYSKGRWFRHSMINRELTGILNKVGVPSLREPSGTHLDPHLRLDGITIVPWERGKSLAWDVTVADTLAPTYQPQTSLRAGTAAARLEAQKRRKYKDILPEFTFRAIGLETLGSMGPSARGFFSDLSRRIGMAAASLTPGCLQDAREYEYLLQRISIILLRSNTMSILASMPQSALPYG